MTLRAALLSLVLAAVLARAVEPIEADSGVDLVQLEFVDWMARHNRTYDSPADFAYRLENYQRNRIRVNRHNRSGSKFQMGLNQFADYTEEEYMSLFGGAPETQSWASSLKLFWAKVQIAAQKWLSAGSVRTETKVVVAESYADLPKKKVDWEAEGVLNGVRNQHMCGGCWAFAAVGATEAAFAIKYKKSIELSEQHMIDCSVGSEFTIAGCSGGLWDGPSNYLKKYGLQLADDYPYVGAEGPCDRSKPPAAKPTSIATGSSNSIELLKEITKGPVAVYIEFTKDMMHYNRDVMDLKYPCGLNLNHAVIAVGFDVEHNPPYIKIRNSHGTMWGERGYARLELRGPQDAVICGMASDFQYRPEFAD